MRPSAAEQARGDRHDAPIGGRWLPTRELLSAAQRSRLTALPEMDERELVQQHRVPVVNGYIRTILCSVPTTVLVSLLSRFDLG